MSALALIPVALMLRLGPVVSRRLSTVRWGEPAPDSREGNRRPHGSPLCSWSTLLFCLGVWRAINLREAMNSLCG